MPRPVPHRPAARPPRAISGTIWCARRWDATGKLLNAASADDLAEYLEEASSR